MTNDNRIVKNGKIIFTLVDHNTNGIIRLVGRDGLYFEPQITTHYSLHHIVCAHTPRS